jgi:hypothetical protein
MKKHSFLPVVILLMSVTSYAQVEKKIEQAMKDPKAAENAGKADALMIDKKNMSDSTFVPGEKTSSAKKEKSCWFKRKKRSTNKSL